MKGVVIGSKHYIQAMLLVVFLVAGCSSYANNEATLILSIQDAESKQLTPARIEVLDAHGNSYVAEDALLIASMCGELEQEKKQGKFPYGLIDDRGTSLEDALAVFTSKVTTNRLTGKSHFYSTGQSTLSLPAGLFKIGVQKGPEYKASYIEVEVVAGQSLRKSITLSRFANMPAKGWYSADDHLHITRLHKGVDPIVLKLMQAEDIHVGNLLQMGRVDSNLSAKQYAHGEAGIYQEGNHLIVSGQENSRTQLLGHTITLGAQEPIHYPEKYLLYRFAWEEAIDQGALNGFAHFGEQRLGLEPGLPILAPHNLMHFMEVLQFAQSHYGTWYDLLNLGFRITPTAGSDYACDHTIAGVERFFTKVEGPFNFKNWLEGVRAGRTFVTTGPLLEFSVNGQDIGSELILPDEDEVTIKGQVRFQNPFYYNTVVELELVENGEVVRKFPRLDNSGTISFEIKHKVSEAAWLALRTNSRFHNGFPFTGAYQAAHSAPIYVKLKNRPSIAQHIRTRAIAKKWLVSLSSIKTRLAKENIAYLHEANTKLSVGDPPLPRKLLLGDNYLALMDEIRYAEEYFEIFLDSK